ncbi:protein adenylyltransferase Fic [Herbaspirillum rubrisubalbicans]|uniref:protein adenylyltransferase Fic n=1 Tax=Herbaspirillum rubrisubalbicans TaxID=80842 RepID=UPI001558BCEB|nr:Fic family protein [Herbaspirillum rubrisubalbicans]NQE50334.1 addiction module protein [Herbaspirillum rubrisubalbicans]
MNDQISCNPAIPYNDLPRLPPKEDIETRDILKACISARAALATLKEAAKLIPNQAILINTIPLLEAQASSEIENIVTTTDRLFQFAQDPTQSHADPATKEALRYRTALQQGFRELANSPLTTRTAVEVCRNIKGVDMDIRKVPGTALMNDATAQVVYTPPQGENLIRELLSDWEKFIHNHEEIDPLIRMAVMHYQFEAIHPFSDGNGRTGRILNLLFLIEKELLELPILYLSRYIIRNKQDYYRLLLSVTLERQWEEWILYMLKAVSETAVWTTNKIRDIKHLMDETVKTVRSELSAIYSRELVELIFTQPYCRIANVVEAGIAQRATASKTLKELAAKGILMEITFGREKLFINTKLMKMLSADGKR